MSDIVLPTGWQYINIEEVFRYVIGGDWGKDPSFNGQEYVQAACIRGAEFKDWNVNFGKTASMRKIKKSSLSARSLKEGDILIEISGGGPTQPVGRTVCITEKVFAHFPEIPIICTNFLRLARPIKSINSVYLNCYLNFFYFSREIENYQSGSNNLRNLKFKEYCQIKIPLLPLSEQKIIAERLNQLITLADNLKTHLESIKVQLTKFRQSVLNAAVTGKLTEAWRNSSTLTNWDEGCLSKFIEKPMYGSSQKSQKGGKVPVLRMGNIQDGGIDWTDLVYTSDDKEIQKYLLREGDVLFNRTNSPELVGKTAIFKGNKPAIYAGYLIKVKCLSTLNPEFLNYHLNSVIGKEYCRAVKSDGVSQSNINAKKLADYPINCPPIKEQQEIANRVEALFQVADNVEQQLKEAQIQVNNLTQSILAKAFKGELTAEWRKQHPELISGENSAQALLERIQAERASSKRNIS